MVLLWLAGVSIILFSPLIFYEKEHIQQMKHIESICSTNKLNALKSDYYTDKPLHNHVLCPFLHETIKDNNISAPYVFSEIYLHKINMLFMSLVYNKKNFPYTFRNNVYINMDNDDVNKIVRFVCRTYYSDDPNPNAGLYIGVFMLFLLSFRLFY